MYNVVNLFFESIACLCHQHFYCISAVNDPLYRSGLHRNCLLKNLVK